jgi:hypothetical protein
MIPLKEEPTVNATLCFSDEDAEALASCQSHIAVAGNVVLASARHENLLAHYTRTLLAGLNGSAEKSVAIRRMPKSSDGLLERLNEHLASLDISTLQTKRVIKTREIWLYELPGPAESELLQMAAKMIAQFKAAGVSIVVHSRQARPDSPHLQKLATRMKAKPVVFQTPTEEQCKALAEKARGCPEAAQINQLINSLGIALESDESADMAESNQPVSLSAVMQQAEKKLPVPQPVIKTKANAPASSEGAAPAALTRPASGVSNTRIVVASGIASALVMALYLSPGVDAFSVFDKGVAWIQSAMVTAPEHESASQADGQPATKAPAIAIASAKPAGEQTQSQAPVMLTIPLEPAETSADFGPAVAAPVEAQDIETTTPIDEEAGLKALFPVALPAESAKATAENSKAPAEDSELPSPAVESGIYVQHASFRLPQSALIWKNNNGQIPGVKVFAKDERFVTVSGPFLDRGQATAYLAEFGITARPYFISANVLTPRS